MPLTESVNLVLANGYTRPDDPDAVSYIAAVEAADTANGQSGGLETATKMAINAFVKGCKADGIWPAIKASCILAGARTRQGALVPLVNASGVAPTLTGTSGWNYNRKTGLKSDGTVKIVSGRLNTSDPLTYKHLAVYVTQNLSNTSLFALAGGRSSSDDSAIYSRSTDNAVHVGVNCSLVNTGINLSTPSLVGGARNNSSTIDFVVNGSTGSASGLVTASPATSEMHVFGQSFAGIITDPRIAFYSFGEYLNLALLSTRVTTLYNAIGAAF